MSGAAGAGTQASAQPGPLVRAGAAVRPVLAPWAALHLLVLAALGLTAAAFSGRLPRAGSAPGAIGWWGWDAGWYRDIAVAGYTGGAEADLRFFPLFPLAGRALGALPGMGAGAALVVVASAAALGYLALLRRLAEELTASPEAARRTTWLAALFPGAGVLVLPYTEALAGLLAVAFLLGLQRRSVPVVVVAGALSGLVRPTGVLLAIVAGLFVLTDARRRLVGLAGAAAPVLGVAGYALWSLRAVGDASAPYSSQSRGDLRGGLLVNPLPGILDDPGGGLVPPVTLLLVVVGVVLLALAVRTLPLPYVVWSAVVLLLAVTSTAAHSLPRYLAGIAPLMIAAAVHAPPSARGWRRLLVGLAVLSGALTASWFADLVVP